MRYFFLGVTEQYLILKNNWMKLQIPCSSYVYWLYIQWINIYLIDNFDLLHNFKVFSTFLSYFYRSDKNLVSYDAMSTVHRAACDTLRLLTLSLGHTNVRNGHTCGPTLSFTASADKQMPGHTIYRKPFNRSKSSNDLFSHLLLII